MAELNIQVKADYSEVVKLQKKIQELRERISRFNPSITPTVELNKLQGDLLKAENQFRELSTRLSLIGKAAGKAGDDLNVFGQKTDTAGTAANKAGNDFEKLGEGIGEITKRYTAVSIAMAGIYAAINQLKGSINTIMSFQSANANLQAILGATDEQMKGFKDTAEALGRSTVFTASQVTALQTSLAKLGFSETNIHAMEEEVLHFAQATGASLDEAASTTGAALRMFNVQEQDYETKAKEFTNAMASATMSSALDFRMIRDNLATFGPMAASMGLKIEDVLALFGKLKDNGVEASTAMTSLRNIFTKVAQGKIEGMGKVNTLDDFVAGLERLKGLDSGKGMKMIGPRGGTQFITLINQAEQVLELRDKIAAGMSQDTTGGMADKMVNNLAGELKMLQSAWEGFVLTFQESDGVMKDVVHGATEMIGNLREMIAGNGDWSKEMMENISTTVKYVLGAVAAVKSVNLVKDGITAVKGKMDDVKDTLQAEILRKQSEELSKNTGVQDRNTSAEGRRTAAMRETIAAMKQEIIAERNATLAAIESAARKNDAAVKAMRNAQNQLKINEIQITAIRKEMQAELEAASVAQTAAERKIHLKKAELRAQQEVQLAKQRAVLQDKAIAAEDAVLQKNGEARLTNLGNIEVQMGRTASAASKFGTALGMLGIPTDPISLAITAVMGLGAAFYYLYTKTTPLEDVMKSVDKAMRDVDKTANESLSNAKLNVATLQTAASSSTLYKDALGELKSSMEQYGITMQSTQEKQQASAQANYEVLAKGKKGTQEYKEALSSLRKEMAGYGISLKTSDDGGKETVSIKELKTAYEELKTAISNSKSEAEKYDDNELVAKHQQLAAAIKEEAEARRYNEAQKAINNAENGAFDKARETLKGSLDDIDSTGIVSANISSLFTDEAVNAVARYGEALSKVGKLQRAGKAGTEEYKKAMEEFTAASGEYKKQQGAIENKVRALCSALGLSEKQMEDVIKASQVYATNIGAARKVTNAANAALQRGEAAGQAMSSGLTKAATAARLAKVSSEQFRNELEMIAKKFGKGINIDFVIRSIGQVPSWMEKETSKNGVGFARTMAANYMAAIEQAQKNGQAFIMDTNKKLISIQEALIRAGQWRMAADNLELKQQERNTSKTASTGGSDDKKKKSNDDAKRQAEQAKRERENIAAQEEKYLQDNTDRSIENLEESTKKKIEAQKNERKKELEATKKQAEDWAKANKQGKIKGATEEVTIEDTTVKGITTKQKDLLSTRLTLIENTNAKKLKEIHEKEEEDEAKALQKKAEAKWEYLQKYGSYEEKELAIHEEYNAKRAALSTDDTYGRKSLDKQEESEINNLLTEKQKVELDWEGTFNDLERYTADYLAELQRKLNEALNSATQENAELIKQKIAEIDRMMQQKKGDSSLFGSNGFFGDSTWGQAAQAIQKQNALELKAKQDQTALDDKRSEILDHYDSLAGMDAKDITADNAKVQAALSAEDLGKLQGLESAAGASAGSAGAGQAATAVAVTGAIIHGVNDNIQSFTEAADMIWGEDSEMAKSVGKFAESSQYATEGFDKLKSGDFIGATLSVGKAVNSLGETFGIWSNSNRAEIEKENERLANAMSVNTEALNRLTKKMEEGTAADKARSYEQAKGTMQSNQQSQLQILLNNARTYDGGHSLNSDFYDSYHGTELEKKMQRFFNGKDVHGLSEILSLDVNDVNRLYETEEGRELMKELTQKMADAGDSGNYGSQIVSDWQSYLSEYSKEAYDELQNTFRQAVTGVSFDSFKDEFKSTLMDMDSDAKDFAKNMSKHLMESVLDSQMEKLYGQQIQDLYTQWNNALTDDSYLSDSEISFLKKKQETLTNQMLATRDKLAAITGYDDVSSSEASGSINSAKSMSEDTANELVGRVTAVQLGVEGIRTMQSAMLAEMNAKLAVAQVSQTKDASNNQNALEGIRQILAESYIELRGINENTSEVVEPIKKIASDISDVKYKMKSL